MCSHPSSYPFSCCILSAAYAPFLPSLPPSLLAFRSRATRESLPSSSSLPSSCRSILSALDATRPYLLSFLAESSQSPRGLSHSRLLLFLHIHASLFSVFTRGDISASRAHRMSAPPRPGIAVRSILSGYGPRRNTCSITTASGRARLAPRLTAAAAQLLQTSLSVLGSQGSAGSRLLECFARPRRFVHLLVVLRRAGCTSSSSLLTKILLHHSSLHPPHSISAFTFPSTALPVWIKSMLRCLSRRV